MESVTEPLEELPSPLATTNSDRCPSCHSRMAPDQRYCVNCGERRSGGGLRDAFPRTQTVAAAPVRTRGTLAATPGSSLIAGIATLLLAMGVGVLIGRSGDNAPVARSAAPQVVTVQTSGGGTGAVTDAVATGAAASTAKSKAAKKHKTAH